TLSGDLWHQHDPNWETDSAYQGPGTTQPWSDSIFFANQPPIIVNSNKYVQLTPGSYGHFQQGGSLNLKSEFDLGFAKLTSYTAGAWDSDGAGNDASV